ncbi:woronin body major protein [Colletotrichum incanum]|uniref:Woronin body major protein n=1 Tax=Colletotrichum incanum TaxID=1573173 RepID=A0A161Y2V2_COLIC|nr:woronin body major protein [Colletotrichum incanum]
MGYYDEEVSSLWCWALHQKLHEAVSVTSYPAPSVVVQTMLAPVFKQHRILDLADGHVAAMTETGDIKQCLSVIDQSNVWFRLRQARH